MHLRDVIDRRLAETFRDDSDARTLAGPLTDNEWVLLQDEVPQNVLTVTQRVIDRSVQLITRTRRTYVPESSPEDRRHDETPRGEMRALRQRRVTHEEALSVCVADHARDNKDVVAFRDQVLAGRLLPPHGVRRWLEHQRRAQGTPAAVLRSGDARYHVDLLAYRVPETGDAVHIAVRQGSVLDRLRLLGEALADAYTWESGDATLYLLTGEVPRVRPIRGEVRRKWPVTARSRIVLTVDPMCTPREVASEYRRWRRLHFGRLRRLTPKHAALAVFSLRHQHLAYIDQMHQWNKGHRRSRYRKVSTFARDCETALHRLREPGVPRRPAPS